MLQSLTCLLKRLNLHDAGAQDGHLEEHRRNVKYQKV